MHIFTCVLSTLRAMMPSLSSSFVFSVVNCSLPMRFTFPRFCTLPPFLLSKYCMLHITCVCVCVRMVCCPCTRVHTIFQLSHTNAKSWLTWNIESGLNSRGEEAGGSHNNTCLFILANAVSDHNVLRNSGSISSVASLNVK